jgi:hypothetical protein
MAGTITTLDGLLERNSQHLAAFTKHRVFSLLEGPALDDPDKRLVFLGCVQRFSSNFQTLLFIRQGLCADPHFKPGFLEHLTEEIGHDQLLSAKDVAPIDDALFEAILAWFNYQMLISDNADRAALMYLVLETGGDYFHGKATKRLRAQVDSPYFETHAELDAAHAQMASAPLQGHGALTYERIGVLVERGWRMIDELMDRVCHLVLLRN